MSAARSIHCSHLSACRFVELSICLPKSAMKTTRCWPKAISFAAAAAAATNYYHCC